MAVNFYIDGERSLVVLRARGSVTMHHWLSAVQRVVADPRYRPDHDALLDCRNSRLAGPSTDMAQAAAFMRRNQQLTRCAVLVDTDASFGLARMFQTLANDGRDRVQPFRSFAEAAAWLQRPDLYDHAQVTAPRSGQGQQDDSTGTS